MEVNTAAWIVIIAVGLFFVGGFIRLIAKYPDVAAALGWALAITASIGGLVWACLQLSGALK